MFIREKESILREELKECFKDKFVTANEVARILKVNVVTLKRFLKEELVHEKTLVKISEFLMKNKSE